jgi:hypothetical protein
MNHVDEGPRLLVLRTLVDHRMPTCMTKRVGQWLLGRQTAPEEAGWMAQVSQEFVASNYDFRALVKAIVQSEMYRRVR